MNENLKNIGVTDADAIERYNLRAEAEADVLKIHYYKHKGDLFAKSEKFKFPRQRKKIRVDHPDQKYKNISEISPALRAIVEELEQLTKKPSPKDIKLSLLADVRHLEKVLVHKIRDLEARIDKL